MFLRMDNEFTGDPVFPRIDTLVIYFNITFIRGFLFWGVALSKGYLIKANLLQEKCLLEGLLNRGKHIWGNTAYLSLFLSCYLRLKLSLIIPSHVQWTWHVTSFFKFAAVIKIQSHTRKLMKSAIPAIYWRLYVNQFIKHVEAFF